MSAQPSHGSPAASAISAAEPMIRLDRLSKRYPGQRHPAVQELSMEIPQGEIVILVGPSGCGKTTTMKMINRIIEPSGGHIFLQGEDVTRANPDQLRRHIGYVIQQIGLFPHMTIAANIATVPGLLGWKSDRIRRRVDELLELVGMDPSQYRHRYPKELSGGQLQRIGVARALAGDPPVMLMDEPFGAIDPITRERLQNEFLRLQSELRKTIVFVTHDIDEAIKMGDRIAILRERSVIAQYDTPEHILSAPADDFVADFVGAGASLKRLNLTRVEDCNLADWPLIEHGMTREQALARLQRSSHTAALLLDADRRPLRWLDARTLSNASRPLDELEGLPPEALVEQHTTLHDALGEMLSASYACAIVVDGRSRAVIGTLDMETVIAAVRSMRAEAQARAAAAPEERSEVAT
jgi:osmoprotectant transport system ATP-binding protein